MRCDYQNVNYKHVIAIIVWNMLFYPKLFVVCFLVNRHTFLVRKSTQDLSNCLFIYIPPSKNIQIINDQTFNVQIISYKTPVGIFAHQSHCPEASFVDKCVTQTRTVCQQLVHFNSCTFIIDTFLGHGS